MVVVLDDLQQSYRERVVQEERNNRLRRETVTVQILLVYADYTVVYTDVIGCYQNRILGIGNPG
jgi:hypothetical protein